MGLVPERAPGITMRQLAELPGPPLRQRQDKRTKSSAVHRRTFAELSRWTEFGPGVMGMLAHMTDPELRWRVPDMGGEVDDAEDEVDLIADDECEVRGFFVPVFNTVNRMAKRRGCRAALQGGGLRSSSADGIAYLRDGPKSQDRSSNVVMTIEFKGKWQFVMPEDVEGLERVLETDEGKVELLHALTQAYGDSVMDETPVFAVSNYETTLFFLRTSATNKALRVSPLVYRDGRHGLPLRASWLWALETAERLSSLKPQLARHLVPKTGGGYPYKRRPKSPAPETADSPAPDSPASQASPACKTRTRSVSGTKRKRETPSPAEQQVVWMNAKCLHRFTHCKLDSVQWTAQATVAGRPLTDEQPGGEQAEPCTPVCQVCQANCQECAACSSAEPAEQSPVRALGSGQQFDQSPQPGASTATASDAVSAPPAPAPANAVNVLEALDEADDIVIDRKQEVLPGQFGYTAHVESADSARVAKVFNLSISRQGSSHSGSLQAFVHERQVYETLAGIQGDVIPRLVKAAKFPATVQPFLLLEHAGTPVPMQGGLVNRFKRKAVRQAIDRFHQATKMVHGDLLPQNILVTASGVVKIIDLASAVPAMAEAQAVEKQEFEQFYMKEQTRSR